MKLVINSTALNKALKEVQPAIASNVAFPALENIKVSIVGKDCFITGTNINLTITTKTVCESDGDFDVLLPFKKLLNISGSVVGIPMSIVISKNIQVSCLDRNWELGKPDELEVFPNINSFEETFSIDADEELLYHLKLSLNCVGKDRDNYIWHDVFFELNKGIATIVSTDRMQLLKYSQKVNSKKSFKCTIEQSIIKVLSPLKEATLSASEKHFRVISGDIVITGSLSENKAPNYDLFFPEYKHNCTIDRNELISELNGILIYDNVWHGVLFTFGENEIKLNYTNPDTEEQYTGRVTANHTVGFGKIFFNCSMLKNLLSLMPSSNTVNLFFEEETKPVHIDEPDTNLNLLLIPLVKQ
jgi:DNA polymerase III sliding clamp (beta) subunit (PCNA family)